MMSIKLKKIGWAGHEASVEGKINSYRIVVGTVGRTENTWQKERQMGG